MSSGNQQASKPWSTWQAYTVAVCALALGATTGYLLRSPAPPAAAVAQKTETAQPAASGGNPHSPEQMKALVQKRAAPMLAKLQKDPNDAATLIELGNLYYDTRQMQDAVQYYERALKLQPSNARLRTDLGNAYYYQGDTTAALAQFEQALQADPKFADALFNIGMIKWQSQGDAKGAVEMWQKLLATNPDHPHRDQVEEMIARAKQHANMPAGKKTSKPAI